jgi:competence protein ComEC
MVTLVILALLLNRYADLLNSLALAAMVLLLVSPETVFLPSFQLSFLSVWAIGYLLPRVWNPRRSPGEENPPWYRRYLFYLWGTFCVSLVTQLATFPVVLWWFHQVSLVGLFSNLILVPLTGILITPLGLLALVFSPLSAQLSSWIFGIMSPLLDWTLTLTGFFAGLPLSHVTLSRPGFIEMGFFYVSLLILFNWKKVPRPAVLFPASLTVMLLAFYAPQLRALSGSPLRITFLDVGHGSAIVIQLPKGEKVLVDGGGTMNPEFDLGERVVAPYLWQEKITALDIVVVTHPHPDHLNGIPFILSNFKVVQVWVNGQRGEGEGQRLFDEVIRQREIPVFLREAGWKHRFSGADLEVLHPPRHWSAALQAGSWHGQNDTSLVLRLTCNDQAVLLPGDIEAQGEASLVSSGKELKSQVLQIPHHGSISSSQPAFIRAVGPTYGVISGRRGPRLPIPHEAVIQRYLDRGTKLYRTDEEGAVTFSLKGNTWEVESYLRGRLQPPG